MQHQDPEAVRGSYINLEIYLICPLHFRYPHPIVSVDLQGDHVPSPLTFSHEYSKRGRKWWTDFWHELFWNLQQASLIDFDHLWILKFSNKNTKMAFFFFKDLHKHLPAGNYDDLFVLKKQTVNLYWRLWLENTFGKKSKVENCHESKGSVFLFFQDSISFDRCWMENKLWRKTQTQVYL